MLKNITFFLTFSQQKTVCLKTFASITKPLFLELFSFVLGHLIFRYFVRDCAISVAVSRPPSGDRKLLHNG